MKNIKTLLLLILLLMSLTLITSCSNDTPHISEEVDQIKLELIEQKKDLNGMVYTLKLTNNSSKVIKQNNVYLSYPIKTSNGSRSNVFKVEAENNKLNIETGEELILTVFAPKEMYVNNNNIDIDDPTIEIKGFINEVTEQNQFYKSGGYRVMKNF